MSKTKEQIRAKQARRRNRWIAAGRCTGCGKNSPRSGLLTCAECALRAVANRELRIARSRATNGCTKCSKKARPNKTLCLTCETKNRARSVLNTQKAKAVGLCGHCKKKKVTKGNCTECRKKSNDRYKALKAEVYAGYGGFVCKCCQETEPAFLSLDHVANDGAKHRKEVGEGFYMYRWAKANNFPATLQVLCMNCQWGKKTYGICPHQKVEHAASTVTAKSG